MKLKKLKYLSWVGALPLLAAVCLVSGGPASAAGCGDEECVYVVVDIESITEDPDPILMWETWAEELGYPLNPGGEARGDGPPDSAIDPLSGLPFVVWAYNIGSSFEVAFTNWTFNGWLPFEFLTANAWNDVDPQLAIGDDFTTHVVWWHSEAGVDDIRMSTRNPQSGGFEIPYVIAENGRRPAIAVIGTTVIVAFERPILGGKQQVVVWQKNQGEEPTEYVLATVNRTVPLQVRLQEETGWAWMYWRHTDTLAGYTENNGGEWGATPDTFPGGDTGTNDSRNIELGF